MKESDVCHTWELCLEVGRVVLEQGKCVLEGLHGVQKVDIHQDIDIELLVAPVDFEQWLEASHEHLSLVVG